MRPRSTRPTSACRSRSSTREEPRRRLPVSRLHPVQGAAARRQGHRRGEARGDLRHQFGEPKIDVDKLRAFKQGVVDKLTAGVGGVAKLRKVKFIQGAATLTGPTSMKIAGADGETELQFEH